MSGPKGASYRVVSEAELRRRAVEAARARVRACATQVEEMLILASEDATRAGRRPALRGHSNLMADLAEEERAGLAYLERLREVVAERRRDAVAAQLTASLADLRISIDLATPSVGSQQTGSQARTVAGRTPSQRDRLDALAVRLVEVGQDDQPAMTESLRTVAAALDAADAGRAAQLVSAFESRLAEALHRTQRQASLERRRAVLAQEFADVPPSDPASLTVAAASDDLGLTRAREQLVAARDRRRRAEDQDFVVAQAADALRALGYRVECQAGAGIDSLVARKDSWPHHGLRLLFPESEPAFTTIPEAYGNTDARDDIAFERASCGDVKAVVTRLTHSGVPTEFRLTRAPGGVPVRHVAPVEQPAAVKPDLERTL